MTLARRPRTVAAALCGAALLPLALGGPALAAGSTGVATTDPTGDVRSSGETTLRQVQAVDMTGVSYESDGTTLTLTTPVVDLRADLGREFVDTTVRRTVDGTKQTWTLTSRVGRPWVKIGTGSAYYRCDGATAMAKYGKDTVIQQVPLTCLEGWTRVKMRSSTSIVRRNGSPIVSDHTSTIGWDLTGPQ